MSYFKIKCEPVGDNVECTVHMGRFANEPYVECGKLVIPRGVAMMRFHEAFGGAEFIGYREEMGVYKEEL